MIESAKLARIPGIRHGFFTREGGVSGGIYASLNCGLGSKDDRTDVAENRARVAARVGAEPGRLATPHQHHSATVIVAEEPWARGTAPKADAVVTSTHGLAVGVSTADCVPVLFADPQAGIAGAAHAGWRGALSGVLEATVAAMEELGAKRADIAAAIGPAISVDAYEVGEEFEAKFINEDKASTRFFSRSASGAKPHFDLTGYTHARLDTARLGAVEGLRLCTYHDSARFFSYRRAVHLGEPDYGRQISVIMLE